MENADTKRKSNETIHDLSKKMKYDDDAIEDAATQIARAAPMTNSTSSTSASTLEDATSHPKAATITHSTTNSSVPPPPWSDLTRDYIYSITAFLPFKEFSTLGSVCHSWRRTSLKLVTRRFADSLEIHQTQLSSLILSPYIMSLTDLDVFNISSGWLNVGRTSGLVSSAVLDTLPNHLPRLTRLSCRMNIIDDETQKRLCFSRCLKQCPLTHFTVTLQPSQDMIRMETDLVVAHLKNVFEELSQFQHLTHLHIMFNLSDFNQQRFYSERLKQFEVVEDVIQLLMTLTSTLMSLKLNGNGWLYLNDPNEAKELIRHMREFTHLTEFDITKPQHAEWKMSHIAELTRQPGGLQNLQRFNMGQLRIVDEWIPLLTRLTNLTHFEPAGVYTLDVSYLSTSLVTCRLNFDSFRNFPSPDILVEGISRLISLKKLGISHKELEEGHLERLLSNLPLIEIIYLRHMVKMKSLSFLSRLKHLGSTLKVIDMIECATTLVHRSEIDHLHSLHSLIEVSFERSFTPALLNSITSLMDPKSPHFRPDLWPHLTTFSYSNSRPFQVGRFWS